MPCPRVPSFLMEGVEDEWQAPENKGHREEWEGGCHAYGAGGKAGTNRIATLSFRIDFGRVATLRHWR